ncbi:MAG: hypothetical protein U5O39_00085 [Gammaproteobacteria bacterium]|nr:hypothetical protein [Gammaproteobacteria bacterium]
MYSALGLLGVFLIFIYGVIVGLYQAPPWETIKFLVVPDEEHMEEVVAEQAARRALPFAQPERAEPDQDRVLESNLLNFDIELMNPDQPINGLSGGLSVSGDRIIIARQVGGGLWIFDESARRLLHTGVFLPETNLEASGLPDGPGRTRTFPPRYTNALVGTNDDGSEYLVVFYGYNHVEEACRTRRSHRQDRFARRVGSTGDDVLRTLLDSVVRVRALSFVCG